MWQINGKMFFFISVLFRVTPVTSWNKKVHLHILCVFVHLVTYILVLLIIESFVLIVKASWYVKVNFPCSGMKQSKMFVYIV